MPTRSISQLSGRRVYQRLPEDKATDRKGNPRKVPKVGRVHAVVFSPDGRRAVGVQVKQPDIAAMIKRPDVFVALDALQDYGEKDLIFVDPATNADKGAIRRLGLDWDQCVIWGGMDVVTTEGKALGMVGDITFDATTGEIRAIDISDGGTSQALLGARRLGIGMLAGRKGTTMLVLPEAAGAEFAGGLAGKAGEATAQVQAKAAELGAQAKEKAGEAAAAAGEAAEKGGRSLGRAIGKAKASVAASTGDADASVGDLARGQFGRAKGMFADFKREFDEASK